MRHRLERTGLVVGIALAVFIVVAVMNQVRQSDQGPLEPTPQPTQTATIGPTKTATPATPGITFDPDPEPLPQSLRHMLTYTPDRLQDDSLPLSDIARYSDIERWMTMRGISVPRDSNDPAWSSWRSELASLAIPEVLATRGADEIWIDTYGFGLQDVHQVLAVGSAPDYVMVLRGDFDSDVLHATWAESGYQAVRVDGITYWSLNPGGSVDLSAPASRPALGNMNNLALLEDGTLIATARSGRMEQTIRTVQGTNPSLAENDEILTLLAPGTEPEKLVSAVLLKGTVLEQHATAPTMSVVATPASTLPEARMVLVGLQAPINTNTDPVMLIVAVYGSADEATRAHQRAEKQLQMGESSVTDQPFTVRMKVLAMRVLSTSGNDRLLLIHLTLERGTADWLEIVEDRDFGFIMWPRVP